MFIGIQKVYVCCDSFYVRCIKFAYIHGRRVVKRQHGVNTDLVKEVIIPTTSRYSSCVYHIYIYIHIKIKYVICFL